MEHEIFAKLREVTNDEDFVDFMKKMLTVRLPEDVEFDKEERVRWTAAELLKHKFLVKKQRELVKDVIIGDRKSK